MLKESKSKNLIAKDTLEASNGDVKSAIAALCDGEYLGKAGYTDDDIECIEDAIEELGRYADR